MFSMTVSRRIPCGTNEVLALCCGTLFKLRTESSVITSQAFNVPRTVRDDLDLIITSEGKLLKYRNKSLITYLGEVLYDEKSIVDLTGVSQKTCKDILVAHKRIVKRYCVSTDFLESVSLTVPFRLGSKDESYLYVCGMLFKRNEVSSIEMVSNADVTFTGEGVVLSYKSEAHLKAFQQIFEEKTIKQISQEVIIDTLRVIPSYLKDPLHNLKYRDYLATLKEVQKKLLKGKDV